jgi:hypothetical protein
MAKDSPNVVVSSLYLPSPEEPESLEISCPPLQHHSNEPATKYYIAAGLSSGYHRQVNYSHRVHCA